MKNSLLAVALAASFGSAYAQSSNVTLYGVADAGFSRTDNGATTVNAITSGNQSGSRVGFRGTEDLGGGLSAVFTIESGFSLNDGKLGQGGRLFGRQSWVGLNGGFGSLKLGRINNPIRPSLEAIDPFGLGLAGDAKRVFRLYDERADNTVNYTTKTVGGFTGQLAYSFGGLSTSSLGRQVGGSLVYANGPLYATLAFHSQNLLTAANADNGDARTVLLGATYNFGAVKAHFGWAQNDGDSAANVKNLDSRDLLVGVSAPLGGGQSNVQASYIRRSDKIGANRDVTQWALGYTYDLSKRTNLYASYARVDNEAAANLGGAAAAGRDPSLFNVGVRHRF